MKTIAVILTVLFVFSFTVGPALAADQLDCEKKALEKGYKTVALTYKDCMKGKKEGAVMRDIGKLFHYFMSFFLIAGGIAAAPETGGASLGVSAIGVIGLHKQVVNDVEKPGTR